MERTFVAIKPDGVQRGLIGEVIRRLERRGLKLAAIRLMQEMKSWLAAIMRNTRTGPFSRRWCRSSPPAPLWR